MNLKQGDQVFFRNKYGTNIWGTVDVASDNQVYIEVINGNWECTITKDNDIKGKPGEGYNEIMNRAEEKHSKIERPLYVQAVGLNKGKSILNLDDDGIPF